MDERTSDFHEIREDNFILVRYEEKDEGAEPSMIIRCVSTNHNNNYVSGDTCCSCT